MKVRVALLALAFFATAPFAAEPAKKEASPAQLAQQEKMKTCNADAGKQGLKGDERKKFMSSCLSAKKDVPAPAAAQPAAATAAAAPALSPKEAQQQKMKTCNADAAKQELKGDDRKKFMSECLKAGTK